MHEPKADGDATDEAALRRVLRALIGKRCWAIDAGRRTGSAYSLDLGAKIPRGVPLVHPSIDVDVREFEPEASVFAQACAWRLHDGDAVVATCADENAFGGPIEIGLRRLVGGVITETNVSIPGWDLRLDWDTGMILCLFPTTSSREDETDYQITAANELVAVGRGARCRSNPANSINLYRGSTTEPPSARRRARGTSRSDGRPPASPCPDRMQLFANRRLGPRPLFKPLQS
jgi:hypothetical protein